MENLDFLRILTGIMYDSQLKDAGEIMKRNPSIPSCFSTSEFSEQLRFVFLIKKGIVAFRWRKFSDTCYKTMVSSHEMYLTYVMFAGLREQNLHINVFDRFMCLCAIVKILCDETLQKTGVNYSDFNAGIIRIIYLSRLIWVITRRSGMNSFVEYIRKHRYLKWKPKDSFLSPDDCNVLFKGKNLDELIKKELRRDGVVEKEINVDEIANDKDSIRFANLILSHKSHKLPLLPSYEDLNANKQKEKPEKAMKNPNDAAENFEDSIVNLSSEFNINDAFEKNQENGEWYEKIIQAVTIHNHSKSSGHENPNNKIQNEANRILEHLCDKIKLLTKVLNEHDKE